MATPIFFGVRHLSPAAAYYVRQELDKVRPDIVLIEGPSDLNDEMKWFCHSQTKLPAAILAYTQQTPIRTLLYPFAVYSPEYQAILWAYENNIACKFMDLPSNVFLGIREETDKNTDNEDEEKTKETNKIEQGVTTEQVYKRLEEVLGESHDTFWERNFEQLEAFYMEAATEFGKQLRETSTDSDYRVAENHIREAYMKKVIVQAQKDGFEKVFCVCGAYHVEGLKNNEALTDDEEKKLPRTESNVTLMPYSYYRLSQHSGYGAGNEAPAYFEMLWDAICKGKIEQATYQYLTELAVRQRKQGQMTSAAEVIEAVRLAQTLAKIRNTKYPVLQDLRDAAVTCIGHGTFSEISVSTADVEIGKKIGELPEGVSRTSIQDDFYRQLKDLNLEKYRSVEVQQLDLDLRENLRVKSQKSAFMDLNRSFFLHRLRVLQINFGTQIQNRRKDSAWGEYWNLHWTPETEIEIVEAALLGETVESATSFALKERADKSTNIAQAAEVFEDAFLCGMPKAAKYALNSLQKLSVDTQAIVEISKTMEHLSLVIRYGDLRKFASEPIIPLLSQLYLRACLTMEDSCNCDDEVSNAVMESIERINQVQRNHDFLEEERWVSVLNSISDRDDINTKCSGFAIATLIERGLIEESLLAVEVSRRLSKGVPADLAAGWFEGLAKKNRYSLIVRLSLWKELDNYLQDLDDEEFKRALVFLRRAFSDFSANEKSNISENLGEIWGIEPQQTADMLMRPMTENEEELLQGLDDFDFGDI